MRAKHIANWNEDHSEAFAIRLRRHLKAGRSKVTKEWPLPIKLVLARMANLQIENVRLNASLCPLLNTNQLAGFISSSTDLMITLRHLSRTNSINTLWMNQLYLYICLRVVDGGGEKHLQEDYQQTSREFPPADRRWFNLRFNFPFGTH